MSIKIEKNYPIYTIILDNPEVKNAVDGPTATKLANAFRNFEKDEKALVAVLWGAKWNILFWCKFEIYCKWSRESNR